MIKLEKFNFEGFPHLCNYEFENNIYVIHGDYEKNIFSQDADVSGTVYLNGEKINNYKLFLHKYSTIISNCKNMISGISLRKNFELFDNNKKKDSVFFLEKYDLKKYTENEKDQIYGILRAVYLEKEICLIEYENLDTLKKVLKFIKKYEMLKKITIIIIDQNMKLNPVNSEEFDLVFIKYFQGYISNKIVE